MVKSKYLIYDFWKSKVAKGNDMWSGLFENKPISKESVIISPVILNPYSTQAEEGWAIYPNIYSVIGFLRFIYLPTAFIRLLDNSIEYQYCIE